ncbi:MAG TPA: OmpH family outer membrane protein [Bacteroidetes bacterium]|nr:OmpH family outer membrane protein [Bacteroidota bacterium]
MKRLIVLLALAMIFSVSQNVTAQDFKFGHIDSDQLFSIMPERDTIIAQMQELRTELQNTLEIMQVEYNNKFNDYTNEADKLSDLVRQTKEEELVGLQQRITNFQQNADQQLQDKQMQLMQPVIQKFEKAIKDVAKENGFTYIFDISRGSIIYFDETKSEDIMEKVKVKLGIQ